ncbi:hypothetical protein Hanom_Chr14g01325001 [Helianthus anomalus]
MFRRFFRLARNGDWYTIEKTQCISQDWVDSDFEPIFSIEQKVCPFVLNRKMSVLDYILLDDPSTVGIEQREIPEGGPSIVQRTEHVRTIGDL